MPARRSTPAKAPPEAEDYRCFFERTPTATAVLSTSFAIVAATDEFCRTTRTARRDILGRSIFEAFPDNPDDYSANGVEKIRDSLLEVLRTRGPHSLNRQRHDIRHRGSFERHVWNAVHAPVLGSDGFVKWILVTVEDATPTALSAGTRATA